uniref:Uncharacterized protein n=1 Tax=Zea mays TaxID=4577 RepID=C0PCT1_MAIZE|nr:unknown [Zea mays]
MAQAMIEITVKATIAQTTLLSRHLLHCRYKLCYLQQFLLYYYSCHIRFHRSGKI